MDLVVDLKLPLGTLVHLFPAQGEDGTEVLANPLARARAAEALGCGINELTWHLPDIFAVRYGSSYVASASAPNGRRVRFLCSDAGDFQPGDDRM